MKLHWNDLWEEAPSLTPEKTPLDHDRIRALVRERTRIKRRPLHLVWRGLAAAAIVCAFVVSASAAVHFLTAGDFFADYFSTLEEGPLSEGQMDAINEIGTLFPAEGYTDHGVTITPLEALADEHVYYLRLRITGPEDTVIPPGENDTDGWYQLFSPENMMSLEVPEDDYQHMGWSSTSEWVDTVPGDNEIEVVLILMAQSNTDLCFNDGVSKILHLSGPYLQSPDKEYIPIYTGSWDLDIGTHFESQTISLDVEGLTREDPVFGTITLQQVELSPLSMTCKYSYEQDGMEDERLVLPSLNPGLSVVLQDGTVLEPNQGTGSSTPAECTSEGYLLFSSPVDLDQVAYIQFGDHQIPLPESNS